MGLFSTKTKVESPLTGSQKRSLSEMLDWSKPGALERLNLAGTPYQGELVAPISSYEQLGLGELGKWLGTEMPTEGKLWGLSESELERTLGRDYYDPKEGQYYQAFRANLMRELEEAKDRLHATTSSRDRYFSSGRVAGEGELEEDAITQMAMVSGQLAERERERRAAAVQQSLGLLAEREAVPLRRIAATQQYGALPRILEQARLSAQYQEWIRQMEDMGVPLQTALQLATFNPGGIAQQSGGEGFDLLGSLMGAAGEAGSFGSLFSGLGGALGGAAGGIGSLLALI